MSDYQWIAAIKAKIAEFRQSGSIFSTAFLFEKESAWNLLFSAQ